MSNPNLRNITNHFQDVRLVSLASWRQANEILPRDRGGPYVVLQEGCDPQDLTMAPDEFALGRSGKWLSLGFFFKLPVAERRTEFVFGTAAEVMRILNDLPSKAQILGRPANETDAPIVPADDEMAAAFQAAKNKNSGKT
jgi:hypothetical protein